VNLLVHGHPGSRLGFVVAVLSDKLLDNLFDVGDLVRQDFCKLHRFNPQILSSFSDTKICIHTTFAMLDRHFFFVFSKKCIEDRTRKIPKSTHD
jgi:hypothetical protein